MKQFIICSILVPLVMSVAGTLFIRGVLGW